MGLFNILFKKTGQTNFVPDFQISEYDNWLNFLNNGGTTEEWESLKIKNGWSFKNDTHMEYANNLKPVSDKYYSGMKEIESDWSILYNSKDYNGEKAQKFQHACEKNIELYKQMISIDKKYGHDNPPYNVPAYKRLAMLYEKQGEFERSVQVCTEALKENAYGNGMGDRLSRMIKKAGRVPTEQEQKLINMAEDKFPQKKEKTPTGRRAIAQDKIDQMQKVEASENYRQKIYNQYYSNYPEMPYISQDRELNTNWIEQAEMFPKTTIIPKSMMKRYPDGLLPGHVYMLYWLGKEKNRRIPSYFEYKYGINFYKEKSFLTQNGYLENDIPTEKGKAAIDNHISVIEKHSEK